MRTAADITVGLFASIQQAVAGFRSLPADSSVPKTFIFTGNRVPFLPRDAPLSDLLSLGLQKIDGAYLAEIFHTAYEKEGFRYAFRSLRIDGLLTLVLSIIGSTMVMKTKLMAPPPTSIGAIPPMPPLIGTPSQRRSGVTGI